MLVTRTLHIFLPFYSNLWCFLFGVHIRTKECENGFRFLGSMWYNGQVGVHVLKRETSSMSCKIKEKSSLYLIIFCLKTYNQFYTGPRKQRWYGNGHMWCVNTEGVEMDTWCVNVPRSVTSWVLVDALQKLI